MRRSGGDKTPQQALNVEVEHIRARHSNINVLKSLSKSRDAPTKFVPLSEKIVCGHPLLDIKRLNAARNLSVDKSEVASKCMAFVEKHTKMHT